MNYNRNNYENHMGNRISINDIIKYINTNTKFINSAPMLTLSPGDIQDENIIEPLNYGDKTELNFLPKNLDAIFSSFNFYRCGVISNVNVPKDVDVSFVSSILTLIIPTYINMTENEQVVFVQEFIRKINRDAKINYDIFKYNDLGWISKEFKNNVKNFKMGKDIIRYITDFLHINIFILDKDADALIYAGTETFIKYKKNIFILKISENHYEPIYTLNISIMDNNTNIIKKLLNSRFLVEYMDCNFNNDSENFNFVSGKEDLEQYIIKKTDDNLEKNNNEIVKKESTQNEEPFISDDMNGFEECIIKKDNKGIVKDDIENPDFNDKYNIAEGVADNAQFTENYDSDINSYGELKEDLEEGSDNQKVNKSCTVVELKKIARNMEIDIYYNKDNGKRCLKTKEMLISSINEK